MRKVGRPIHLAGANGFPVSLYRPLQASVADCLGTHYLDVKDAGGLIASTDVFGHVADYPDWSGMVQHLVSSIERRAVGPVVGVGHSLGGALMGCAAAQRPDLFHKLIIIDSPFFCFPKRFLLGFALYLPEDTVRKYHPIIKMASRKPLLWKSKIDAQEFFKQKKIMKQWDSEVLDIFLNECIIERDDNQAELLFPVKDECDIYYKAAIEVRAHSKKYFGMHDFPHKAHFLYSEDYHILDRADILWMRHFSKANFNFIKYDGSHFWPFDDPIGCGKHIADLILAADND